MTRSKHSLRNKRILLFILLLTASIVLLFLGFVFFRTFIIRIPDPFGIDRRDDYNSTKNNPPIDICTLDVDYDGYEYLPDEITVEGKKYKKQEKNDYLVKTKYWETHEYVGKLLIKPNKSWDTGNGFGYCWSDTYVKRNHSGDIVYLVLTRGCVYVDSNMMPGWGGYDFFTKGSDLFDGYGERLPGAIMDLSTGYDFGTWPSLSQTEVTALSVESAWLQQGACLVNIDFVFGDKDIVFLCADGSGRYILPHFYLTNGVFYCGILTESGITCYKITDASVISFLEGLL